MFAWPSHDHYKGSYRNDRDLLRRSTMKHWRFLSVAVLVIVMHQATTRLVFDMLGRHDTFKEVLPFFNFVQVWNPGISFGMLSQLEHAQWLLSGLAIAIIILLLRWLSCENDRCTAVALSFVIGGAIGNTVDRLRFGAVADYLDFHAFGWHWPAFNLTDAAIFIGVCLLLYRQTICEKNTDAGSVQS